MKHNRTTLFPLLLLISAGLTLSACDNAVEENENEHAEAYGVRLVLNGVTVYQVFQGQVSCASEPCGVTIAEGEETALITAIFLDEDEDVISQSILDRDEYSMGYEFESEGIAEFEQHEEDGKWSFHLHGESAGSTRFQIKMKHGDHADFTTPPLADANAILITVTE